MDYPFLSIPSSYEYSIRSKKIHFPEIYISIKVSEILMLNSFIIELLKVYM